MRKTGRGASPRLAQRRVGKHLVRPRDLLRREYILAKIWSLSALSAVWFGGLVWWFGLVAWFGGLVWWLGLVLRGCGLDLTGHPTLEAKQIGFKFSSYQYIRGT